MNINIVSIKFHRHTNSCRWDRMDDRLLENPQNDKNILTVKETHPNRADSSAVAAVGILLLSLKQNGRHKIMRLSALEACSRLVSLFISNRLYYFLIKFSLIRPCAMGTHDHTKAKKRMQRLK